MLLIPLALRRVQRERRLESFLLPPLTVILSEAKDLRLFLQLPLLLHLLLHLLLLFLSLLLLLLHLPLLSHLYFYNTRKATADPSLRSG